MNLNDVILAHIFQLQFLMSKLDGEKNLKQKLEASKKKILEQSHQIKEQDQII